MSFDFILERKCRHFLICCEQKNILKASRLLRLSQPALSQSIKALETELGYPLFVRSPSGLLLTEKGKLFHDYLRQLESTPRPKNFSHDLKQPMLRVGAVFHFSNRLLFSLLEENEKLKSQIQLFCLYSRDCLQGIDSGDLDLAFVSWTKKPVGYLHRKIAADPFFMMGRKDRYAEIEKAKKAEDLRAFTKFFHPKPQMNYWDYFDRGNSGILVKDSSAIRELILSGAAIGEFHLNIFNKYELKQIAVARKLKTFYSRPDLYMIWQPRLSPEKMDAVEKLTLLCEKRMSQVWSFA